jgi:adenosine deaminase
MNKMKIYTDTSYKQLPKVDLHRHLEGSLRLDTLIDIARTTELMLPLKPGLRALVQMQPDDPLTFETFLSKFETLRLFYLSPEIIARITREAVADAAADHVRYLELRFTPVALSRVRGFSLSEVMDWVCESASESEQLFGVRTRLIASVNRHESLSLAEEVVRLAIERTNKGIVGLDLAGNEAHFPAQPFADIFRSAKSSGLYLTVHAGEWAGAENVRFAIENLQADRIGHGVRIVEDANVVALARERGTAFEVCLTSNYQTGAVSNKHQHPIIKMLDAGLQVTLNTDDPSISNISLSDEYRLVCEELHLPRQKLYRLILTAAQASFLPPSERQALLEELRTKLIQMGYQEYSE